MTKKVMANQAMINEVLQEGVNAQKENPGGGRNHMILKVNYENCDIPIGAWCYGQKKTDNDEIEFSGYPVGDIVKEKRVIDGVEREILLQKNALVPLIVRQRYNLYDKNNPANNCNSPLFRQSQDQVYGNNHGYPCNAGCPYRDKNLGNKRCKMEFVLFGIVPTEEEDVPVVAYIKGDSYMPFLDWKKSANIGIFEINGAKQQKQVRMCTYYLTLGSVPKKNGIINYFQGYFEKGKMLDDLDQFRRYVKIADELIDVMDSQILNQNMIQDDVMPSKAIQGEIPGEISEFDDIPPNDDIDDIPEIPYDKDDEIAKLKKQLEEQKRKMR